MFNWDKRLRNATIDNNLKQAEYAISKGADVNKRDHLKLPLLHHALLEGHVDIARLLIFSGADVNLMMEGNQTPLMVALEKGFAEIAYLLIQRGAVVNIQSDYGCIPLNLAAKQGFLDVVHLLLQLNADVNSRSPFDGNKTPLHLACERGHVEVARLLIEYRADVSLEAVFKKSAYKLACQNGHGDAFFELFGNPQPVRPKLPMPRQQINKASEAASSSQSKAPETFPECKICLNNKANHVLIRCGHIFCLDCINQSRKNSPNCPICRELIQSTQKLYF